MREGDGVVTIAYDPDIGGCSEPGPEPGPAPESAPTATQPVAVVAQPRFTG
jgi:hypothetical protein